MKTEKCAYCGEKFNKKHHSEKYCSDKCRKEKLKIQKKESKERNKRPRPRVMPIEKEYNLQKGDNIKLKIDENNYVERTLRLNAGGYLCFTLNGFTYLYHRCLMFDELMNPKTYTENYYKIVHHKDFNRLNNTKENLILLTKKEHSDLHANVKICKWCHKPYLKTFPSIKYCSEECAKYAKDEQDIKAYKIYVKKYGKPYQLGTGSLGPHMNDNVEEEFRIVHKQVKKLGLI